MKPASPQAAIDAARTALSAAVGSLPNGVVRDGQQAMCDAVANAFANHEHLLVQAGTGTGKSLAYLVPAVLAGKRVVIVTATKALQEQLCNKDLPFLQESLDTQFSFAQLKGRSNYVCLARKEEVDSDRGGALTGIRADDAVLDELDGWISETTTGERGEAPVAIPEALWAQLSIDSQECPGKAKCSFGESCFAEKARDNAAAADIVVVNTALYAQHLVANGKVLPPHDFVVVDEAHSLEDIAADAFGVSLGATRLNRLAAQVRTIMAGEDGGDADLVIALSERAKRWSELLGSIAEGQRIDLDKAGLRQALLALNEQLSAMSSEIAKMPVDVTDPAQRVLRVARFVNSTREDVQYMLQATPARDAIWVERRDPPVLNIARIDVGPPLSTTLFSKRTAVLASATLALGDDFAPMAWRLGLRPEAPGQKVRVGAAELDENDPLYETPPEHPDQFTALDVGSPFDYRKQAILYCAAHLPDPRKEEFANAWIDEAVALIDAAGGRTLGLCTSLKAAAALREALQERLPLLPVLSPDDMPRAKLMVEFAKIEHSCLIGSLGLWQGIDVVGPAVSLVIVDKLPFSRPNDPLAMARREQAENEGQSGFETFDLPRAALLLAQGVGRLIRSDADRGVVAIMDRRLVTSSYGAKIIDSLPPMYRMTNPDRVKAALQRLTAAP